MTTESKQPVTMKQKWKRLPKWLRICIYIAIVFLLLLVLLLSGITWYINHNKKSILKNITAQLSEKMDGTLTIRDMQPSIWKNFPHFSIRLEKVMLYDTMYGRHQIPMLDVESVFLQLDLSSLMTQHPEIEKITVADGAVNMFTDNNYYSNLYLLKPKNDRNKAKKKKELEFNHIVLEDIHFSFTHQPREKKFDIQINDLDALINTEGDVWNISAPVDLHIGQLGFKLSKGGFLVNTDVSGKLSLQYNPKTKDLIVNKGKIKANDEDVWLSGAFHFGLKPVAFSLVIEGDKLDYTRSANMLSSHIAGKLKMISLKKPVHVFSTIDGHFRYPDTPTVHVNFEVKDNTVITDYGDLEHAEFSGLYNNEVVSGGGHTDHNSEITIPFLRAKWQGIPVNVDSIDVLDLIDPYLQFRLYSTFPVKQLNNITSNSYSFANGNAKIDLKYAGPLASESNMPRAMYGFINIQDATLTYVPRALTFNNCTINMQFTGEDLLFKNIILHSKSSTVNMEGIARKFMNVYFEDPEKVLIDWNIHSQLINMNDFAAFLTKRVSKPTKAGKAASKAKIQQFNKRISDALQNGSMHLNVNVNKAVYDKFIAENIKADVDLLESGITIHELHIMHAGGTLDLNGAIDQAAANNPFKVNVKVANAKVDKLFYSFDNFGLTSLTSDNIRGIVSANVNLAGGITDGGKVLSNTFNGNIDFELDNGALLNFDPFLKIQKFIFKKRNLDSVMVKPLKGRFIVADNKITIAPLNIRTSALDMNVKGVYGFDKGTEIDFEIPLRNPKKNEERVMMGKKPRKGIIIYLHATDDENGKLKISWDPNKKGWQGDDADQALQEGQYYDEDSTSQDTAIDREAKKDTVKTRKRFSIFGKQKKHK